MCGIVGVFGPPVDAARFTAARDVQRHRGPDDAGEFTGPGVQFGARRLSIIDLHTGHQPIGNEDGTVWVTFNGEIFNFAEIRVTLEQAGHQFRTHTDTEVVVHAYEEWGDACADRFRGMFAFGIWDGRRDRLLVVRDRLGIKPLYWAHHEGRVLFASEAKSLLALGVPAQLDPVALQQFLGFLYVPAPRSIFKAIKKLQPGWRLIVEGGVPRTEQWWDLPLPEDGMPDDAALARDIRDVLRDSVRYTMVSDVPVGAFLSGGLDSSGIVAMMAEQTSHPVETFSLRFRERHFDEGPWVEIMTKRFNTRHHEFTVEPDLVAMLPRAMQHHDEPFANGSALLIDLLSGYTKQHVSVALAGTGGDELFSGYPRYRGVKLAGMYDRVPRPLRALAAGVLRQFGESADGRGRMRRARGFAEGGLEDPIERYLRWTTYFGPELNRRLVAPAYRAAGSEDPFDFFRTLLRQPDRPELLDRVFYADMKSYLVNNQLEYNDKMSMANSLEVRVPFCDHVLAELAARIPAHRKTTLGDSKRLLKAALRGVVPDTIIDRPKVGLNPPVGLWFQGALQPLIRALLSPAAITARGYFDPAVVQQLIDDHVAQRRDYGMHLWALLVFEVWHRMYLDGQSPEAVADALRYEITRAASPLPVGAPAPRVVTPRD